MLILSTLLVALAAAAAIVAFVFETLAWSRDSVWRRFGMATKQEAEAAAPFVSTLGFATLFFAIGAVVGVILFAGDQTGSGAALVIAATAALFLLGVALIARGARFVLLAALTGLLALAALIAIIVALSQLTT